MKKNFFFTITLHIVCGFITAQAQITYNDTAALYFSELQQATKNHFRLWDTDLYAPVLIVNRVTREVYANVADSAGVLKKQGAVFYGELPASVNISNTSLRWSGVFWAMVMLPLPTERSKRMNLLVHELFHRAQPLLGFTSFNPENNHLDKKDGRIYLRLELEALKEALNQASMVEVKKHIGKALEFRRFRHQLYPGADSTENLLELNEGICEFTGAMMSGRNRLKMKEHFIHRIDAFISSPSYIRSFGYETTPVYGYLLSSIRQGWNKEINVQTNLTDYFSKAFTIQLTADIRKPMQDGIKGYNSELIFREEEVRAENLQLRLAAYRRMFIDSPHLEIQLINMNMSFDYTRMVSLDTSGIVYPEIRITDNWGILEVEKGALISREWNRVNVTTPVLIDAGTASGEGWKLKLNNGFGLHKDAHGNYSVRKK